MDLQQKGYGFFNKTISKISLQNLFLIIKEINNKLYIPYNKTTNKAVIKVESQVNDDVVIQLLKEANMNYSNS